MLPLLGEIGPDPYQHHLRASRPPVESPKEPFDPLIAKFQEGAEGGEGGQGGGVAPCPLHQPESPRTMARRPPNSDRV